MDPISVNKWQNLANVVGAKISSPDAKSDDELVRELQAGVAGLKRILRTLVPQQIPQITPQTTEHKSKNQIALEIVDELDKDLRTIIQPKSISQPQLAATTEEVSYPKSSGG